MSPTAYSIHCPVLLTGAGLEAGGLTGNCLLHLLVRPDMIPVRCRLRQAVLDLAMACLHVAFLLWLLWHLALVVKSWGEANSWKEVSKPAAGVLVDATICVLQALGECRHKCLLSSALHALMLVRC